MAKHSFIYKYMGILNILHIWNVPAVKNDQKHLPLTDFCWYNLTFFKIESLTEFMNCDMRYFLCRKIDAEERQKKTFSNESLFNSLKNV